MSIKSTPEDHIVENYIRLLASCARASGALEIDYLPNGIHFSVQGQRFAVTIKPHVKTAPLKYSEELQQVYPELHE